VNYDEKELTYNLSYKEVVDILQIINETTNCQELHLELGDLKLTVIRKDNRLPFGAGVAEERRKNDLAKEALKAAEDKKDSILPEPPTKSQDSKMLQSVSSVDTKGVAISGYAVKSPLVGTFYGAPAPGAPPFVEVGSKVKENDIVGIIDVMKLMNTIKAGQRGVVREICVENEQMVEYGQTLMIIDPAEA